MFPIRRWCQNPHIPGLRETGMAPITMAMAMIEPDDQTAFLLRFLLLCFLGRRNSRPSMVMIWFSMPVAMRSAISRFRRSFGILRFDVEEQVRAALFADLCAQMHGCLVFGCNKAVGAQKINEETVVVIEMFGCDVEVASATREILVSAVVDFGDVVVKMQRADFVFRHRSPFALSCQSGYYTLPMRMNGEFAALARSKTKKEAA